MPERRLAYRVVPWEPSGSSVRAVLPSVQGGGRFDDPERYRILYAAATPEAAVAESLAGSRSWTATLDRSPRFLVTVTVPAEGFADLDDPNLLAERGLRPSRVVWPDRVVTQGIARDLFAERRWIGVRWWSRLHAPWTLLGLWALARARIVGEPDRLTLEHPAVRAAAELLDAPL